MKELIETIKQQMIIDARKPEVIGWNDGLKQAVRYIESYDPWHKWPAENLEPGRYWVVCDECPVPIVGYYEWDGVSGWADYGDNVITVTLYTELPAPPEDV